ncbi:MAG: glycosyltransferase involved in cell wall biosynthesis [Arenicella sp.]|jgi:glycosyltransferase involved in cell wall biosynthesis
MKTVLITAYAVNPYKGSEDGVGWNISNEISKKYKVILITRKNNIPHIARYMKENPDACVNMEFHGFDLPAWAMWFKKRIGERGYVLYFYFWQMFVALFAKQKGFQFDLAHSLNFHSDSQPNFLWMLGKPTFWGPVGHHPKVPKAYVLSQYGLFTFLKDRLYFSVKWMMRNLDPFFHLAVSKSVRIFAINSTVGNVMGAPNSKVTILPAVASESVDDFNTSQATFKVLSVGRFHYMKGFDLTIRAFAQFLKFNENHKQPIRLVLVGKGEEDKKLQTLASDLDVDSFIDWVPWVDKKKMDEIYRDASVFLFPSHEGAGMVIPEAMSYGLPVVCFDNEGPGELAKEGALKVVYSTYQKSVNAFAQRLGQLYRSPKDCYDLGSAGRTRFQQEFTWEHKGNVIASAYDELLNQDEKPKTIAVFHPSSELYGADRILVNALNALPGDVNKRVYLKFNGPLVQFIRENVNNVEVEIVAFMPIIYREIFTPIGIFKFVFEWVKFVGFVKREHKSHSFISAYINTLSTAFILPIAKWHNIRNYIHVHEIIDSPRVIGWATAMLCQKFANRVVCVSQAVLDGVKRYVPELDEKTLVLHNGIEPINAKNANENGKLNFYLFGRIMPKKGQWYLMEALSFIPKEALKNCRFILMGGVLRGNSHLMDELEEYITSLGIKSCVEIRDFAPNIVDAMSDAHVCLVPSMMKDPFPTTVLEAMSANRPVIATNHGGAKEAIVDGESGLLVAPDEPEKLANFILSLIRDSSLRKKLGNNASLRFRKNFTLQHFNSNWKNFNRRHSFV